MPVTLVRQLDPLPVKTAEDMMSTDKVGAFLSGNVVHSIHINVTFSPSENNNNVLIHRTDNVFLSATASKPMLRLISVNRKFR